MTKIELATRIVNKMGKQADLKKLAIRGLAYLYDEKALWHFLDNGFEDEDML